MTYSVKEIFYTLQGEGHWAGRPAVFCRFAGCNLWSGREADRTNAICKFCDTDFVGTDGTAGGKYDNATALAEQIQAHWASSSPLKKTPVHPKFSHPLGGLGAAQIGGVHKFVVFTGGEPLLQLDRALIDAIHAAGFEIAVETNGTVQAPEGIDWLCVSPKAGAPLIQRCGHELKVVVPQPGLNLADLEGLAFDHFRVQPMDGPQREAHTQWAVQWCLEHPRWHLSLQTHKLLGIR